MKSDLFNETMRPGRYFYRRSPVSPRAFLILKSENVLNDPVPVGDYTVLDREEDINFSEKKVMNLISILNGRRRSLVDLGSGTNSRTLFHMVTERDDEGKARIVFYRLDGKGVSKENAFFRIEGEV